MEQETDESGTLIYTTRRGVCVGGYELGAILGRGGFSSVYETWSDWADPEDPQQDVCIKVGYPDGGGAGRVTRLVGGGVAKSSQGLRPDEVCDEGLFLHTGGARCGSVSGEDIKVIFRSEYELLRGLDTRLLPKVSAAGVDRGAPFYVMEHIRAHNLRDWHYRRAKLNHVEWFTRLLADLVELRRSRPDFYHGDLKPENMLVTYDGFRLVDPALRPDPARALSTTISVAYNPLGLACERADTLAIAIMLFEFLAGVQPFAGYRSPWRLSVVARPERDEYESSLVDFLNLGRFASFTSDAYYKQLLEWMRHPPPYEEMLQALKKRGALEGKTDASAS